MPHAHLQVPERLVVVVDDDAAVRRALCLALKVEGFTVRLFSDAESLLSDDALPSDGCLVVDYRLPGLDGLALLERLRARGIDWPAVLITTPTRAVMRLAAAAGVPVLDKPLLGGGLVDQVRAMAELRQPGHQPSGDQ